MQLAFPSPRHAHRIADYAPKCLQHPTNFTAAKDPQPSLMQPTQSQYCPMQQLAEYHALPLLALGELAWRLAQLNAKDAARASTGEQSRLLRIHSMTRL